MLEEEDTTLLFQVELMDNNMASQGIGLPSSKVLKKERAIMVKKHIKMSNILGKSSHWSATVNISYFQQAKKLTKEKLSALGKVLQSPKNVKMIIG